MKKLLLLLPLALVSCSGDYTFPTYTTQRVNVYDRYGYPYYNRTVFPRRYYGDHRRYCPPARPVRVSPRSYQRNDCR